MTTVTFSLEQLDTPTGKVLLVTDGDVIRALDWETHEHRMQRLLQRHYGKNILLKQLSQPSPCSYSLQAYFEGELMALGTLQTATNGTDFQKRVWSELRKIPVGQTLSYGQLATNIGKPSAARAVGLANGSNPIAIVVPCHRVIGANSSLTGFGGGLARKHWLLNHENVSLRLKNSFV